MNYEIILRSRFDDKTVVEKKRICAEEKILAITKQMIQESKRTHLQLKQHYKKRRKFDNDISENE